MAFKGHATGLHALLGGGVIVSPGCTFELLARFDAANQGFANGQVLDTLAEGVDIGQLTVVEVDGTLAIVGNEFAWTVPATPAWDELGFIGEVTGGGGITKTLGKGFFCRLEQTVVNGTESMMLIWCDNAGVAVADWIYLCMFNTTGTTLRFGVYDGAGGVAQTPVIVGTWVVNTDYTMACVLGGYDANGVPWDNSQAAASYLYGTAMFIKGGAFTDWTLLYRSVLDNVGTLYPCWTRYGGAGNGDDLRVPTTDYSAVLQPTVKDTFTDANGTSLDAHTPDVSPGGVGWTERFGNWDIQGNKANVVNDGGGAPRAIATTPSNLADMFCRATGNLPGPGQIGIVFRYVDNNNFWTVMISDNANTFTLFEFNAGVSTSRATVGIVINPATDYEITVIVNGNDMACYLDGANRLVWTSAIHAAATVQGTRGITANSTLDNFHIQPRAGYTELDECP